MNMDGLFGEAVKGAAKWAKRKLDSRPTDLEKRLLLGAFENGGFLVLMPADGKVSRVRSGATELSDWSDDEGSIAMLDALESIEAKGYVKRDGPKSYRITAAGIEIAKKIARK